MTGDFHHRVAPSLAGNESGRDRTIAVSNTQDWQEQLLEDPKVRRNSLESRAMFVFLIVALLVDSY